jgi:hypothetical protein
MSLALGSSVIGIDPTNLLSDQRLDFNTFSQQLLLCAQASQKLFFLFIEGSLYGS